MAVAVGLDEHGAGADLVITGKGGIDSQTIRQPAMTLEYLFENPA